MNRGPMNRGPMNRRGTAAIEFALAFPLLLVAFLAAFELFRLVQAQRVLDLAVTQALRYGAVRSTSASSADIQGVVTTTLTGLLGSAAGVSVTVGFSPAYAPGDQLSVSAQLPWTADFLPGAFAAVTLDASGAITVQN
jgi:Flp pilus assembly protein TadG